VYPFGCNTKYKEYAEGSREIKFLEASVIISTHRFQLPLRPIVYPFAQYFSAFLERESIIMATNKESPTCSAKDIAQCVQIEDPAAASDPALEKLEQHHEITPREIQARFELLRDLSDAEMESLNKRLVRKIDWRMMPTITLMFLMR
jgi:hypothetical protein